MHQLSSDLPPFRRLALSSTSGDNKDRLAQIVGAASGMVALRLPSDVRLLEPAQGRQVNGAKHSPQLLLTAPG